MLPGGGGDETIETCSLFRSDSITQPANGLDGRRTQFSPEAGDEHFHRVRIPVETLRVNVLRQFALRNHTSAVMHEVREHTEFVAGQFNGGSIQCYFRDSRIEN